MKSRWVPVALGTLIVGAVIFAIIGGLMQPTPQKKMSANQIEVPPGYRVSKVATGLTFPTSLEFGERGELLIAEAGYAYGPKQAKPRVVQVNRDGTLSAVVAGLNGPVNGIRFRNGRLYISHRGKISVFEKGRLTDLVTGLPSWGDHHNNDLVFGPDGKLYFGQGTATNAGIVGNDNFLYGWVPKYPKFHDIPAHDIRLSGLNRRTVDLRTPDPKDTVLTGAFVPFGTTTSKGQVIKGAVPATGAIIRMNPDGTQMENFAWGLRNPFGLCFSPSGRLYVTNNGYDNRGLRPVENAADQLYVLNKDDFCGWPDFSGDIPLNDPRFRSARGPEAGQVMMEHPPVVKPLASFPGHAAAMKMDIARGDRFGGKGDIFVALFGSGEPTTGRPQGIPGHQVVRVDPATGQYTVFARNRNQGPAGRSLNGFNRPIDVKFSPDGKYLYVLDFGVFEIHDLSPNAVPGTGVLWRIEKTGT